MLVLYTIDNDRIKWAYSQLTGRRMPKFALNRVLTEFRKHWESKISHAFSVDGVYLRWTEPDDTGYSPIVFSVSGV